MEQQQQQRSAWRSSFAPEPLLALLRQQLPAAPAAPAHPPPLALPPALCRKRARVSGFRAGMASVGGRKVLAARRKKGRKQLVPASVPKRKM